MTAIAPLLTPFRFAGKLRKAINKRIYRQLAEPSFRALRRGRCDRCWCGGELEAFPSHAGYGVCAACGCYVNRCPPLPEELARLYSFNLYWHLRQKMKGQPAIEARTENDRADGRVARWIEVILRYGPASGRVVEAGCAHGVLLRELCRRGFECIGIEPDPDTASWCRETAGLDVRAGLFPDLELPPCNLFLAFDVLEHTPDPLAFVRGAAALLGPGGVAILQTPIDRYDYQPPFGERFHAAFDDLEHLHLFTDRAMRELARRSGLEVVDNTQRLWLHHEICVFRKTA